MRLLFAEVDFGVTSVLQRSLKEERYVVDAVPNASWGSDSASWAKYNRRGQPGLSREHQLGTGRCRYRRH